MALRILMILAITVAGALFVLMLHAGEPAEAWWWLLALPFGAWIIGVAVAPYFLARRVKRPWFVYVMLAFLLLSTAWSAIEYHRAFFVSESSTAALVMIFVPLYQWVALAFICLLSAGSAHWLDRRRPRT